MSPNLSDAQKARLDRIAAAKAKKHPGSSPVTPSPTAATRPALIVYKTPSKFAALIRDGAKNGPARTKRMEEGGRYCDGDLEGVDRDPKPDERLIWNDKEYSADMRINNGTQLSYGEDQVEMTYYGTTTTVFRPNPDSLFLANPVTFDADTQLPWYTKDGKPSPLPVNVRCLDDYLGACWLAKEGINLAALFPFDIHPDGFPFPDRRCCGIAFRPRANLKDYPTYGGLTNDMRIGYIRCGKNGEGGVVFLGGDGFDVNNISEEQWANLHHHYIDITDGIAAMVAVTDENEEIQRTVHRTTIISLKPPNAADPFADAFNTCEAVINNILDKDGNVSQQDRAKLLDNIPTRGYRTESPTWDVIQHAALAGVIHESATRGVLFSAKTATTARTSMLKEFLAILNLCYELVQPGNEAFESATKEDLVTDIALQLIPLYNNLVKHASNEEAYRMEMKQMLAGIPSAGTLLTSLPVVTQQHADLMNAVSRIIWRTEGDSNATVTYIMPLLPTTHLTFTTPVVPNYVPKPPAYDAPYAHDANDRPTHRKLLDLFLAGKGTGGSLFSPVPIAHSPPTLSPESARKKVKATATDSQRKTSRGKKASNDPTTTTAKAPAMVWRWKKPSDGKNQVAIRAACKEFGCGYKDGIPDTLVMLETYVNEKGLGTSALGVKHGGMFPKGSPRIDSYAITPGY